MTDETNDQGAGGTAQDEDAELRQALETLKRIIERPKRAPFGTNDVWGWSTGKEHSLEPGTLPREQVVERIRGSYSPQVDGEPVAERIDSEISDLELPQVASSLKKIRIMAAEHVFVAWIRVEGSTWYIREDGKVWKEKNL